MVTNTRTKGSSSGLLVSKGENLNCLVGLHTKIEGDVHSKESVRIDGEVVGDFSCGKKLVLGETGTVNGSLIANEAVIMGEVHGEVEIKGLLYLVKTAKVHGNIKALRIKVEEGAVYNGACSIGA